MLMRSRFPPARSYPTSPAPFAPADLAVRQPASGPAGRTNSNGLPFGLWRGLDLPTLERLIASLQIPPRSISLQDQWRRLLIADVPPPTGGNAYAHFQALRLEALYRSGLARETDEVLAANRAGSADDPLIAMLAARSQIGAGRRKEGCDTAKRMQNIRREIPKSLRGEAILVSGYCAASSGNKPAAGLLAELAREEGLKPSPGLAALDAVALGVRTDLSLPQGQKLSLIDCRILELGGATPEARELVQVAAPPLLVAVANDPAGKPDLRLAAGEAAARINAYALDDLAVLYRSYVDALAERLARGWVDDAGEPQERIVDVVWSDGRAPAGDGRLPPVGSTVNAATASYTNEIGARELIGHWTDDDFDPAKPALYYARVIEIPTPRWTTYDAVRHGMPLLEGVPVGIQERAWTSPIWYIP